MPVKHISKVKMPNHFILLSLTEIRFKDTNQSYPVVFSLSLGFTLITLSRSSPLKKDLDQFQSIPTVFFYIHIPYYWWLIQAFGEDYYTGIKFIFVMKVTYQ